MKKQIAFLLLFFVIKAYASHNRSGEITYKHISGYTFEISITTYTKESSKPADKCSLNVHFGDGDTAIFYRVNGKLGTLCGGTVPEGETIGVDIKKNIYTGMHTFKGPDTYIITMDDPNRNSNICNFSGTASDQIPFSLRAVLVINSFSSPNNSPVLVNPPIEQGCAGQCFSHNIGAVDMDGDSLYYALVPCYGNGVPIPGFNFPPGMTSESINHSTGTLEWCGNNTSCYFNIAIQVEEWKLVNDKRYFAGSTLRDMQVEVTTCMNHVPQINKLQNQYVEVGDTLHYQVSASDEDTHMLSISATGAPFLLSPAATFTTKDSMKYVKGDFTWSPVCSTIRNYPYQVTLNVKENINSGARSDYDAFTIRVIAPAVRNVKANPSLAEIGLLWEKGFCLNTGNANPLTAYLIYRKKGCDTWEHQPGETGVPVSAGYQLIGSSTDTTFADNNNGAGFKNGEQYTYIIVAQYKDGALSYASKGICTLVNGIGELVNDIPVIISPNPNNGTFSIVATGPANYSVSKLTVSVRNALGQLIHSENLKWNSTQTITLNAEPGIYIVELRNDIGVTTRKMIIRK